MNNHDKQKQKIDRIAEIQTLAEQAAEDLGHAVHRVIDNAPWGPTNPNHQLTTAAAQLAVFRKYAKDTTRQLAALCVAASQPVAPRRDATLSFADAQELAHYISRLRGAPNNDDGELICLFRTARAQLAILPLGARTLVAANILQAAYKEGALEYKPVKENPADGEAVFTLHSIVPAGGEGYEWDEQVNLFTPDGGIRKFWPEIKQLG